MFYVDDNPAKNQAVFNIIQRMGYSCVRISDALQDLSQLLKLMPQLIFIDLAPPIVNSYELCAQIRQISVFTETPIILVTDNNNIIDRLRPRLTDVSGSISKPMKAQQVLKVLIKYLDPLTTNL